MTPDIKNAERSFDEQIKGMTKKETEYPPFFTFEEEGDWIKGMLTNPRTMETKFGEAKVIDINTPQKETFSITLTSKLEELYNLPGKVVLVKYIGDRQIRGTKKRIKDFDIYIEG